MIYTLTLNPCIDYYMTLDQAPIINEVTRASSTLFKVGGKGLNISRSLELLNIPSKAIALLGGFSGQYIVDQMKRYSHIELVSIMIEGMNRINVKIHYNQQALCINDKGPYADRKSRQQVYAQLEKVNCNDFVVISGSMMQGLDEQFLSRCIKIIHQQNALFVLDMENITRQQLQQYKPWLIKPNLFELEKLFNRHICMSEIDDYLESLKQDGVENILLSCGKDGAILSTQLTNYQLIQPGTNLINKVGCGDAMLAGYLGGYQMFVNHREALKYGGAFGNATASKLEDITLDDVKYYLALMDVKEL